jgi:formylglycine-generating enzyme required for sulfatase activity/serine/threonine protein kinase
MLAEFIQLPKEGESVGPYLLRQHLSSSILGSFFMATHKLKHENVLLHILPEALMRADARFEQRYKEAMEKQKQLPEGPAMAPQEFHRIGGNLVVQYPAGNYKSLNEIILSRKDPMPEERVRDFLSSIAKGLMESGKVGLGHYFLTPDFLFVNEDGELRIAGIGIFQSVQYECFERFVSGAVMPVTVDKKRNFTALEILSPEIRNFKSRDLRSDFYCIGMCAYFMLTGTKPERRWATPTKARQEIDEGWDLFISRCLEPKPVDRFPNYKGFLRDLENIDELAGAPRPEGKQMFRTLNRLPLPQTIENRLSLRQLVFLRLLLLGLSGILTIGTASIFHQIIFSDFESDAGDDPIRRVAIPDQANLVFDVSPVNAIIIIRGPENGRFTPRGETLYLRGRGGRYTVQVSAPRHKTVSRMIDLRSSKIVSEEIKLVPNFTTLRVDGVVGTELYVLQQDDFLLFLGEIPAGGSLQVDNRLLPGSYKLVGLHEGLIPAFTGPVRLGRAPVQLTLEQPPRPTELVVSSEPAGATVLVDGSMLGTTPLRVEELEIGRPLLLRVEKKGYRPFQSEIKFSQGETLTITTGALEPRIGTLSYSIDLSMPDPPDLREVMFSIDGELRRAEQQDQIELPEGAHSIELVHPDYLPLRRRIVVVDRESVDIELRLEPRPLRLLPTVDADSPVRFLVDGQETGLTEQGYLPVPANRPAKVEAVVRDFLTVVQWFQGRPNERMDWNIPLKPIPGPVAGDDWSPPYFDLPMVWVPSGSFSMGSPLLEFRRLPNEDSSTRVQLEAGFWVGTREVTQDLFQRVMRANPSQFNEGPDYPVDSVDWPTAVEFCRRLTDFEAAAGRLPTGYEYRLPTEAEWEYAARAGTGTAFSFGETADPSMGNFHGIYQPGEAVGKSAEERYGTLPVASFTPNAFGLYDVHGNVAEWTLDRFWDRHPGGQVTDPINLESGRGYTLRGGSWRDSADRVRSAAREGAPGSTQRNSIGFRVVLAPVPKAAVPR